MARWDADSNEINPSADSKLMSVDEFGALRYIKSGKLQAFVQGKIFGTIAHDAVAPTPGETGEYTFSTGGVCTWLDVFPDTNTVMAGDRVLVIYNVLLDAYSYELQPNEGSYATVGELEDETAARTTADSEFYAKAIEPIANNAAAPTPDIPIGTTKTYEFSTGGAVSWLANQVVEKGDKATVAFTAPSTFVRTYQDVVSRKIDKTSISISQNTSTGQKEITVGSNPTITFNDRIVVAAYDSDEAAKEGADIVAGSESAGVAAINTALQSLENGGKVYLRNGTYGGNDYVSIPYSNIVLEGESYGASIIRSVSGFGIVAADGTSGVFVKTLSTNNDVINATFENVVINTRERARNYTTFDFIIAASNSSTAKKKIANYVCSGSDDQIDINAAINNMTDIGGRIKLLAGTYVISEQISINHSNVILEGEIGGTIFDVSGLSSNAAIITANSSNNVTVVGINVANKDISLNNSGSGHIYASTYLGKYHHFDEFLNGSGVNPYNYLIAASNAPAKFKQMADLICSGSNDEVEIINAIQQLTSGGVIQLSPGTFNLGSYINVQRNGITIRGCGYSTVLNRSSLIRAGVENGYSNVVFMDLNLGSGKFGMNASGFGNGYVYRCWAESTYYHQIPFDALGSIFVPVVSGISGINAAITALGSTGGRIVLQEGEYTGTNGIEFTGSNVIVEGNGLKTVIHRSNSTNDAYCNTSSSRNNILRNLTIYSAYSQRGKYLTQKMRLEGVWNNGDYINQQADSHVTINIGEAYHFKTLSPVYSMITADNMPYNNRFEINVYGHIVETSDIWIDKPVNLIGHHALIELRGPRNIAIVFGSIPQQYIDNTNMIGWWPVLIQGIHFIKTGCFNYGSAQCVTVIGNQYKFIDCVFENASSSPSPFNNAEQAVGAEDDNGRRRSGISVETTGYEGVCRTEFHNCIGIGSPYGFQSCRGWYFKSGSPKVYNCIGIGGGIGEYGHGILSHEASNAQLFNCIGYAGEYTYRRGAGIRFQASGANNLHGCIGYGSHGTQLKSEGIPEETVLAYCSALGIADTTWLYTNGEFDYSTLTIKATDDGHNADRLLLGNNFKNSDIVLTSLMNVSEEGYGISLWAHNGMPDIINCKGFAGQGAYSKGLHIIDFSRPRISGGYFGLDKLVSKQNWSKDSNGYCKFTIPSTILSPYVAYQLINAGITIGGSTYSSRHLLLYIQTDEANPQVIVDGYDLYNHTSIGTPTVNDVEIPAGVGLVAYLKENGSVVTDYTDSYFFLMLTLEAHPEEGIGLYISENASPQIFDAEINANEVGVSIFTNSVTYNIVNCKIKGDVAIESDKENIRVYDSLIDGTVDNSLTFSAKVAVNGSSNYNI